jgi:hypothetical protein
MFQKNRTVVIFRAVKSILLTVLDPEDEGIFILVKDGKNL